jgi:polysaccharide biosynthesis PFTS motif protein
MITSCVQPKITLIARDFAYCKIAQYLDDKDKLEAILLTCSNYTEQPLFTRELKNTTVHMVWYAQAWKPVVYASASVESDLPNLRWIRVDKHWVWTQSFSNYISELGISKSTEVVGPIVWCRPPQEISSKKEAKDKIRIVVFDASPFSDEVALCNGQLTNYHNPKNLHSFIQGLLELKSTLEKLLSISVELTVKTKRGYNHLYDKEYFDYLNKLELEEIIKLPHHSVNLYELIDQCDFVIAYPFTSPTYIADTLRVPSIYFDPTGDVVSHDFGDENSLIKYSSGFDNLLEAVKALLNVNESKASQSI